MAFVTHVSKEAIHDAKNRRVSVLDVGSYDVNGSVRRIFVDAGCDYLGVDRVEGPNVGMVMNAHDLTFPDEAFDVVVSCEMLEHDSAFWLSLKEMGRVLKRGGTLIITARGNGFIYHNAPDYWRFMPESAELWAELSGTTKTISLGDGQVPGIFFVGSK
jgi:SAM-dependent methyltransferase